MAVEASGESPKTAWYRSPIERERLRELTRRSDAMGLLQALSHLGLLVATGCGAWMALRHEAFVLAVCFLVLHGTIAAFLLNGLHELSHGTVFRTIELNPVLRFLYWQMNFHTEHHMYAAVPFYNLPRLHAAVQEDLPESCRGLASAWRQILTILQRQKTEPGYQYTQPLQRGCSHK